MSGSPKEQLQDETSEAEAEAGDERELYLRNGKKLVVTEAGNDQVVEIRSESGMLELRIQLTEQGPVLQMEAVRMQLKATEAVAIESKVVEITATERATVAAKQIEITSEEDTTVEAHGDVRVVGKTIFLN